MSQDYNSCYRPPPAGFFPPLDPNVDPQLQGAPDPGAQLRAQQAPSLPVSAAFPLHPGQNNTPSLTASPSTYHLAPAPLHQPYAPINTGFSNHSFTLQPPHGPPFPPTYAYYPNIGYQTPAPTTGLLPPMAGVPPPAPGVARPPSLAFTAAPAGPVPASVVGQHTDVLQTRSESPPRPSSFVHSRIQDTDASLSQVPSAAIAAPTGGGGNFTASGDDDASNSRRSAMLAHNHSWAARNINRPVLAPRQQPPKKQLTDAEKRSNEITREKNRAKAEKLRGAINNFNAECSVKMEAIAKDNQISVKKVKNLVHGEVAKKPRKAQLHNAILHAKSLEINEDLEPGEKMKLIEIQRMASQDDAADHLTEEQKTTLINELIEHRKLQHHGVRANNIAAARDFMSATEDISGRMDSLSLRTGAYSFFFSTPSSVNDRAAPAYYGSDNAIEFLEEVLGLDADEVIRKFQQWACAKNENTEQRDTLQKVRAQIVTLIQTGLRNITNNKSAVMNYVNYHFNVIKTYHCHIVGWDKDIRFANPSEIGVLKDLRKLRDDLKDGKTYWATMTKAEVDAHMADIEKRRQEGEVIGKARKQRASNKRKATNKENQPAKKSKKSSRKVATSAVIIEDSDEHSDDE